ncbi:hypothetical protein AWC38_SpisGene16304 [Stylophora pistillata]|uniref:Uncharacterized protein n=1 Tax=Stylophora pistillata TaxID=50429 RepID=A0A2B4RNV3_STYPI|nr:hypothetical protein AWC38_SpisGene16304 [Stylophora pistillata]
MDAWTVIEKVVERVIQTYPRHRDISKKGNVEEGYTILRSAKLVNNEYQLYEELVEPYHAFTENGQQELIHGVSKLVKEDAPLKIAIYTCGAYIFFFIGCRSRQLFPVYTHPIGPELGRKGNGIFKVYPTSDSPSQYQLYAWIWKRLQISGVQAKAMQSLLMFKESTRDRNEHLLKRSLQDSDDRQSLTVRKRPRQSDGITAAADESGQKNNPKTCHIDLSVSDEEHDKYANGEIVNGMALLQYHISCEAEKIHFQVQSHRNRKKSTNTPFYPTAKSTLQALRDQLKEKPLSQAFNVVSSMTGGPTGAKSAGELPRSRKQVNDVQAHSKRDMDPVEDLVVDAVRSTQRRESGAIMMRICRWTCGFLAQT